jgi:hypothetical protein
MRRLRFPILFLLLGSTGCDAPEQERYEPNTLAFEMNGVPHRFELRPSLDGFVDGQAGRSVSTLGVQVPVGESGANFMLRLTSSGGVTRGTYQCGPTAREGVYVGLIYSADATRIFTGTRGECALTLVDVDWDTDPRVVGRFAGTVVTVEGERINFSNGRFHFIPEVIRW